MSEPERIIVGPEVEWLPIELPPADLKFLEWREEIDRQFWEQLFASMMCPAHLLQGQSTALVPWVPQ